ncbi:MAG: MBL fold metallo-hydrolase [Euryarchaeota archaeon]|nr:MBL fold metallo-hydrolase [Euryarchaeota archaeon]
MVTFSELTPQTLQLAVGKEVFMGHGVYKFNVGSFKCATLSDGSFTYPSSASLLFTHAPVEEVRAKLREHHIQLELWTEWISPYTCIAIDTGAHHVLIDTGGGSLGPDTGHLTHTLATAGITPTEVDSVIITHAHPDHLSGGVGADGASLFPCARFFIHRDEWKFWTSAPDLGALHAEEFVKQMLVTIAQEKLGAIRKQVTLVDGEHEVVPGIRALAASGHTPGHIALSVSSNNSRLLCLADTVLHPLHVEVPEWYASVDLNPERTVSTRYRLLSMAAHEKSLVHAFHFPFPALGYVIPHGERWRWQAARMR